MQERIEIKPQPGPQTEFFQTSADIAIFGGSAGSGKSFALLLEPIRHHENGKVTGAIFRRNATQVRNPGGLWDESHLLYPHVKATPREMALEWHFPSGMSLKFAHLEHETTYLDWQGSQITYLGFDELTHFTQKQFFYMLSRNRSTSGVRPYVRATTNPDADSWVRKFLDWWIDPKSGFPIKERSGKLRWFIRLGEDIIWADTKEELIARYGVYQEPKSVTFISALLTDNKILMEKDPGYLGNLMALDRVERERLLNGNWNVRPSAGMFFRRSYFPVIEACNQQQMYHTVRYWDRAATVPGETNPDPDYTVGLKMTKLNSGVWVVLDVIRMRESPKKVQEMIRNIGYQDGHHVPIILEQDPGSAGIADVSHMTQYLGGFDVRIRKPTKDKITRAKACSAQAEAGNVLVLKATWNDAFLQELENFPEGAHDDQVDALSGAFNELAQGTGILSVLPALGAAMGLNRGQDEDPLDPAIYGLPGLFR